MYSAAERRLIASLDAYRPLEDYASRALEGESAMAYIDRRSFLKGLVLAGAATAIDPLSPVLAGYGERRLADPLTWTRFHPPLSSVGDLDNLARLIREFSTPEVVGLHHLLNGAHGGFLDGTYFGFGVGREAGEFFFCWHRNYLSRLQEFLSQRGRVLPSWAPWEEIPGPFRQNIASPVPGCPTNGGWKIAFSLWSNELIGYWPDPNEMGFQLSWGPHFQTHVACGGDMAVIATAPQAPIFWAWHQFIDDLWESYLTKKGRPPDRPTDWPFKEIQDPLDPRNPPGPNAQVVFTPWCIGLPVGAVEQQIRSVGLAVGEKRDLSRDTDIVISQRPLPFTSQERDRGRVDLSGTIVPPPPPGSPPNLNPPSFQWPF